MKLQELMERCSVVTQFRVLDEGDNVLYEGKNLLVNCYAQLADKRVALITPDATVPRLLIVYVY